MQIEDFLSDDQDADDFLAGAPAADLWSEPLEDVRGAILDWGAATVRARHPDSLELRGSKGQQQCRQDMDLHLRHLLGSTPAGAAEAMTTYRNWLLSTIWQSRTAAGPALESQAAVLAEALARFAPWPVGLRAAAAVAVGLGAPDAVKSKIAELDNSR